MNKCPREMSLMCQLVLLLILTKNYPFYIQSMKSRSPKNWSGYAKVQADLSTYSRHSLMSLFMQ